MKKILRSKRKEIYDDSHTFLKRELYFKDKPDNQLSCNHIDNEEVTKALVEYKAINLPKPVTKSVHGFFLSDAYAYDYKQISVQFNLIGTSHYCLKGSDKIEEISELGYKKNDVSISKEQIWEFISIEENRNNKEWVNFLIANPKWGIKLKNYRDQKKKALLFEWQKFGGGYKVSNIKRMLHLDREKATSILSKIIEAEALDAKVLSMIKQEINS